LPPEVQKKILNFVKEINKEVEDKKIDETVDRFIREHKNVLLELAKN